MRVLTKQETLERLRAYAARYISSAEAARRAGVTNAQMSLALSGQIPVPPKLQAKIRVRRVYLYVVGKVDPDCEDTAGKVDEGGDDDGDDMLS